MYLLAFIFISSILGCDSDNDLNPQIDKKDLIGKWVNTSLDSDTLFWYDTKINRPPKHSYTYTLNRDSIIIKYTGEYYIEVFESSHKISLNNDKSLLTIEEFDNYFPKYEGVEFKKKTN